MSCDRDFEIPATNEVLVAAEWDHGEAAAELEIGVSCPAKVPAPETGGVDGLTEREDARIGHGNTIIRNRHHHDASLFRCFVAWRTPQPRSQNGPNTISHSTTRSPYVMALRLQSLRKSEAY